MLSSNELYYFNAALDGREIYAVELMENLFNQLEGPNTKEDLIKKNLINEDGSINTLSFIIIDRLRRYKSADSYIWVDDKVLAMYDNTYDLVFLQKDKSGEFIFEDVTKSIMVAGIFKDKPFLLGDKEADDKQIRIRIEDFYERILQFISEEDMLSLRKMKNNEIDTYNIYFTYDEILFKYNVKRKKLMEINPKKARKEILTLFQVKEWKK